MNHTQKYATDQLAKVQARIVRTEECIQAVSEDVPSVYFNTVNFSKYGGTQVRCFIPNAELEAHLREGDNNIAKEDLTRKALELAEVLLLDVAEIAKQYSGDVYRERRYKNDLYFSINF